MGAVCFYFQHNMKSQKLQSATRSRCDIHTYFPARIRLKTSLGHATWLNPVWSYLTSTGREKLQRKYLHVSCIIYGKVLHLLSWNNVKQRQLHPPNPPTITTLSNLAHAFKPNFKHAYFRELSWRISITCCSTDSVVVTSISHPQLKCWHLRQYCKSLANLALIVIAHQ